MRPVAPKVIPACEPKHGPRHQAREQRGQVPGLEFKYSEAGAVGEGVFQDEAREGVVEVVKGEGEEVEGFAVRRGAVVLRGGRGRGLREGE